MSQPKRVLFSRQLPRQLTLLLVCLALPLLSACGNRGSLYLPEEATEGAPAPTAEQRRAAEEEEEDRADGTENTDTTGNPGSGDD